MLPPLTPILPGEQRGEKEKHETSSDESLNSVIPPAPPPLTEETAGLPEGAAARMPKAPTMLAVKRRIVVRRSSPKGTENKVGVAHSFT